MKRIVHVGEGCVGRSMVKVGLFGVQPPLEEAVHGDSKKSRVKPS